MNINLGQSLELPINWQIPLEPLLSRTQVVAVAHCGPPVAQFAIMRDLGPELQAAVIADVLATADASLPVYAVRLASDKGPDLGCTVQQVHPVVGTKKTMAMTALVAFMRKCVANCPFCRGLSSE
jgi:hypothetical protein